MIAILKREISSFFASPMGYLVFAIYLLMTGLSLWVFKGDFNLLDNGFADLSPYFQLAPWILIFLVPAVTMRSISEEKKQGTLELLLTRPISRLQIILGKYLGSLLLIIIALLPSFLYIYTVYQLGNPIGNIDLGSVGGSFIGLLFLAASYTAIGIFASSISDNQIVAFIIAVFLCFFMYFGFEGLSEYQLFSDGIYLEKLGMDYHFNSMSRGVIDFRDIIYFLTIIILFIFFTVRLISTKSFKKNELGLLIGVPVALLLLNFFAQSINSRIDLTADHRYTLSESALKIVENVESPILIDVFLEGDFPSEYRRLQTETKQILEEFSYYNSNIKFTFYDPLEDESLRESNIKNLAERGLQPLQLTVQENGKSSQELIFPWALASYNGQTVNIPLLKNKIGASQPEIITNSIQNLEYAFAEGFKKLTVPKDRKIAILKGNGQLQDVYIADFLKSLKEYYNLAPFTLDSVANNPLKALKQLEDFDLIISAKPSIPFTEEEKLVLDQFTMNGGKSLWLTESIIMDKDSLYNESASATSIGKELNLTDFFFKYGARINPVIVQDLYSAPITLAMGEGSNAQFQQLQWPYSPLASNNPVNPITKNINLVRFDFASQIDTLKNNVEKIVLLKSSELTKLQGVPSTVNLEIVTQEPDMPSFNDGPQNLAVLLQGKFTSVYNNRVLPFELTDFKNESESTKMIIIADGDVIKNEVVRNQPQELGFDRASGRSFGNKEFLLNAVNYLLNDDGLINIRTKDIIIPFLDTQKVSDERSKWQFINLGVPLLLLGLFGLAFNYFRKRKYT
ncbi:ABC-2 type transport system permease protein [Flavobacteriaceae bacterium MAR_2010_188]|nr:ABC-2 type transport system permease protein [Flavobacteriaceae bacterium MAR_2010_188]